MLDAAAAGRPPAPYAPPAPCAGVSGAFQELKPSHFLSCAFTAFLCSPAAPLPCGADAGHAVSVARKTWARHKASALPANTNPSAFPTMTVLSLFLATRRILAPYPGTGRDSFLDISRVRRSTIRYMQALVGSRTGRKRATGRCRRPLPAYAPYGGAYQIFGVKTPAFRHGDETAPSLFVAETFPFYRCRARM